MENKPKPAPRVVQPSRVKEKELFSNLQREALELQLSIQNLESKITGTEMRFFLSHLSGMHDTMRIIYPLEQRHVIPTEELPTFPTLLSHVRNTYHHANLPDVVDAYVEKEVSKHQPRLKAEVERIYLGGEGGGEGSGGKSKKTEKPAPFVKDEEAEGGGKRKKKEKGSPFLMEEDNDNDDHTLASVNSGPIAEPSKGPDDDEDDEVVYLRNGQSTSLPDVSSNGRTITTASLQASDAAIKQKKAYNALMQIRMKSCLQSRIKRLKKRVYTERLKEIIQVLKQTKAFYEALVTMKANANQQSNL